MTYYFVLQKRIFGHFSCFIRPALGHGTRTNPSPWSILKDVIFLDNKVQRFAIEILEKVIWAVLAHSKIVENHAFSQEGKGLKSVCAGRLDLLWRPAED